jgi:hypothetical protein
VHVVDKGTGRVRVDETNVVIICAVAAGVLYVRFGIRLEAKVGHGLADKLGMTVDSVRDVGGTFNDENLVVVLARTPPADMVADKGKEDVYGDS